MEKSDLPEVGQLAGALFRMHYAFDAQRFLEPHDPERGYQGYFAREMKDEDVILLVAEGDEGAVVGYAYARLEPRNWNELLDACCKLHDVFVSPTARARGVGHALLQEVFARAAARGAPRVVLLTASQNEAAQKLFAKVGFRTTMLEMTRELVSPSRT